MAVRRWLAAQGGLEMTATPRLYAITAGLTQGQPDQIALYLVLSWKDIDKAGTAPDRRAFFAPGALPQDIDAPSLSWISEANEVRASQQVW